MPRLKRGYRSASRENYKKFCLEHPEITISSKKFYNIIYTFSHALRDKIIETGEKIQLPFGMGELSINKKKTRRFNKYNKIILPVDWQATKLAGKRIYLFNEHTEGYKFKWMWFRQKARFRLSDFWVFKPSRVTSRLLAEYLKKPNSKYQYIYREYKK